MEKIFPKVLTEKVSEKQMWRSVKFEQFSLQHFQETKFSVVIFNNLSRISG